MTCCMNLGLDILILSCFQVYFPSAALVLLSFTSFWVPPTVVPARVALIVTNFLASCVILRGLGAELPKTVSMTSIEKYVIVNLAFIALVCVEFLLVSNKKVENAGIISRFLRACSSGRANPSSLEEKGVQTVGVSYLTFTSLIVTI